MQIYIKFITAYRWEWKTHTRQKHTQDTNLNGVGVKGLVRIQTEERSTVIVNGLQKKRITSTSETQREGGGGGEREREERERGGEREREKERGSARACSD